MVSPKTERKSVTEMATLVYPPGKLSPTDFQRFIQLGPFTKDWKALGLHDEDLRALEILIMIDPRRFPVIPGTGRLRKMRFRAEHWGEGKQGGIRVCYAYFPQSSVVTLFTAYAKGDKDDLSPKERKTIKRLLEETEQLLAKGA